MQSVEFYRPLIEEIEYKGKTYKLTPSYDNVLSMFHDVKGLDPTGQAEVMLYYLMEQPVYDAGILYAINEALFPPSKKTSGGKVFDFIQDGALIYAAFMQAYGIDLIEEQGKLHWWKFQALFGGLPSNTKFIEVVSIRRRELPKPNKHNAEQRAELMRLKQLYALDITQEEREQNLQEGLKKMAMALIARAGGWNA